MSKLPEAPQSRNIRKKLSQGLAMSAMSLTAAIAPGVQAASAETPTGGARFSSPAAGGVKAPEYTGKPTAQERKINAAAQRGMDLLARRIVNGKVVKNSEAGPIESTYVDEKGQSYSSIKVTVPAPSLYDGQGAYEFDVISKARDGQTTLHNVSQVFLTEGELSETGKVFHKTYTSLSLLKNRDNGIISAYGIYASPKDPSQYTTIEAATFPRSETEAHLTKSRLGATLLQANQIIDAAIQEQPVGVLSPAFIQPSGSLPVPLK